MRKNLTIFCDDDSLDESIKRQIQTSKHQRKSPSPLSKTNKHFGFIQNLTSCQTPQSRHYPQESFEFKSAKYVGMIQKSVLQRLKLYEQKHKDKKQNQEVSTRIKEEQNWIKQLRQKPEINEISKNLFEKVRKQRKLSPNILERFQTYECQRVSRNAKYELLKAYGLEAKNTTLTCRNNINQKSKSPLKQSHQNKQESRSKSRSLLKKTMNHSQYIGKIVCRKPKEENRDKKDHQFATEGRNIPREQIYSSLTPIKKTGTLSKKNNLYQKQQNQYETQANFNIKKKARNSNIHEVLNRSLSPINQKKHFNKGQKWKVIV